jgi:hypothetical protein
MCVWGVEVQLHHSCPRHWMEVTGNYPLIALQAVLRILILLLLLVNSTIFRGVRPCSLIEIGRRFGADNESTFIYSSSYSYWLLGSYIGLKPNHIFHPSFNDLGYAIA